MINVKKHLSVLLEESIEALNIQEDGIYIDATFGRGGHSQAILEHLGANGRLLVIDKDHEAIKIAQEMLGQDSRCSIYHGSFANLALAAETEGITGKINGILWDLGVSSPQIDDAARGFSFNKEGPLDMRMDTRDIQDAASWIHCAKEEEIANVLYQYGEERHSRRIAKAIVEARAIAPFETTTTLAECISKAHPDWPKNIHPATKSFQAIRIFINHELDDLDKALTTSLSLLAKGGRLAVISFHSLEDRIVKQFMQKEAMGIRLPSWIPITSEQESASIVLKKIGRIRPSQKEITNNPRARSATLRIGEKIS